MQLPSAVENPAGSCLVAPSYRAEDPLGETLRHVTPGLDAFIAEGYAAEIEKELDRWSRALTAPGADFKAVSESLSARLQAFDPAGSREEPLRHDPDLEIVRRHFPQPQSVTQESFARAWESDLRPIGHLSVAEFKLTGIRVTRETPLAVATELAYDLVGSKPDRALEQRTGVWQMDWLRDSAGRWQVERWAAGPETRSRAPRPLFSDIAAAALGGTSSYREQMLRGLDDWRSALDAACGIDVYGNTGLAVGDFDGDGYDDFYVCEPAGLPNRLYRNRGDGTFEDVTERAGVGVLDNTACALFADFLNRGRQDLLVVRAAGPLLFLNRGDGRFELKPDAFRFGAQPQGTFTGAASADYDRDGKLDVYFCLYSYYLALNQYNYPAPYYDAQNGPPNFLFHNEGDGTFRDRTREAGLDRNNNRYSFACAWADWDGDGWPDLYVANDFGRKNLYRNNGDGTFMDVAGEAGVEDYGAGMSVCGLDYNNDGLLDLYVADMWSAAGQRVTRQSAFQPRAPDQARAHFQKHAAGNSLFRNLGQGKFRDATAEAGVAKGRWAWCADAWDFDQDGYSDLYIANGFISGPQRQELASFFWRQVVAQSPLDASPSPGYEKGWNAINELIRSDGTWSGYQRNVFFANNRNGSFSDVSGVAALDFPEDSRSFALTDIDRDGRLEFVLKNRNSPRLRLLRNQLEAPGDVVAISLRGRESNRDAVGAVATLETERGRQTKTLQAGSGFLTQHTKDLFFGLGKDYGKVRLRVRWPSGRVQEFADLPPNQHLGLEEGAEKFEARPFRPRPAYSAAPAAAATREIAPATRQTWLLEPLPAPAFSLLDLEGQTHSLEALRGHPVLLIVWDPQCAPSGEQLKRIGGSVPGFAKTGMELLAIGARGRDPQAVRAYAAANRLAFPVLVGDPDTVAVYNLTYRYLLDRHTDMPLPMSFLVDDEGKIIKIYQGQFAPEGVVEDWRTRPRSLHERLPRALPFPGDYYGGAIRRNQFTYGVAFFERGYADQAIASFKEAIASKPDDADAYYNLGTLYLRKRQLAESKAFLEKAVKLKPVYPDAWNNLGMIAAGQGRADEAIRDFQRAIEQNPADAIALENLGNLYRQLGKHSEAQETLRRAVQLAPNDPQAVYSLGMVYAEANDLERARTCLERAVELKPDFPNALNNLGVLLLRAGDASKAEAEFQQCIRVAPDFDQPYLNLARLYATLGGRDKARSVLEQFLTRHPDSTSVKEALRQLAP